MTELPREARKSLEEITNINGWFEREYATIMTSESLTNSAKREHLQRLRAEYGDKRTFAEDAARRDLEEWTDIYESRAAKAWEPKPPSDRDAAILRGLEVQRLHNRRQTYKDRPGVLLGEYERAVQDSNDVVAHELEQALPELLPADARADFEQRARENRLARMGEDGRKRVAELEEWKRQASETGLGLAL